MMKQRGKFVHGEWTTVLADISDKVRTIMDRHGSSAIGIYGGTAVNPCASMNIWRNLPGAFGTSQFYSTVTIDLAGMPLVAERISGHPWLQSQADPDAKMVILVGINPIISHGHTSCMPSPKKQLRQWADQGELWVVDPKRTESAEVATRHLAAWPGSEFMLLGYAVRELLRDGADQRFLDEFTTGIEDLRRAVERFTLDAVAAGTRRNAADIRDFVTAIRKAGRIGINCGTGISMGENANATLFMAWALHAVTGSLDRAGGAYFNPGFIRNLDKEGWTAADNSKAGPASRPDLPSRTGEYPCAAMADEIEAGNIKAMFIFAGNPILSLPDASRLTAAFAKLELVIMVDVIETASTPYATHLLPGTGQMEMADLTMFDYVQLAEYTRYVPRVVEPVADRKPLWWILKELARRLDIDIGIAEGASHDDDILRPLMEKARATFEDVRSCGGVLMSEGRTYGWTHTYLPDGRWNFGAPDLINQLASTVVNPGPLLLVPSRQKHRLNSQLNDGMANPKRPDRPLLSINPEDAQARQIEEGDRIAIRTGSGTVLALAHIDDRWRPGVVSLPHGFEDTNVNVLTSAQNVDRLSGMVTLGAFPVVIAKRARAPLVERTRLLRHLDEARAGRISLLRAPAGYGKSLLLRAWAKRLNRNQVDVVWINADEELVEPSRFISALMAAMTNADIDVNQSALSERPSLSARSDLRRFVATLRAYKKPLVIIIDDYARAAHAELDEFISHLLHSAPDHVHFAIATQTHFDVPLGTLWLDSQTIELTPQDLRMTEDEISSLFNHSLAAESLARLSAWTEGWPTAVALAQHYLSTTPNDEDRLEELFHTTNGDISRYLMDHMIKHLPEQHREMLIQTSFLESISDELAEAVIGFSGTRQILQDLEQSNILITPMDETGTWYRCHQILRNVMFGLLRRRGPRELSKLQLRASSWYKENGNLREAICYARDAGDFDRVANYIIEAGGIFHGVRYGDAAQQYLLERFPVEYFNKYPRVNLTRCYVLLRQGRHDFVADIIYNIGKRIKASQPTFADDPLLIRDLAFTGLLHAMFCSFCPASEHIAAVEKSIADTDPADYWLRGIMTNILSVVQYRRSDFRRAIESSDAAQFCYEQTNSSYNTAYQLITMAHIQAELADLERAKQNYHQARIIFTRSSYGDELDCLTVDLMTAALLYDQGRIDEATRANPPTEEIVEAGLDYFELLATSYRCSAMLALANDGPQAALNVLSRAIAMMRRKKHAEVERFLVLCQMELGLNEDLGVDYFSASAGSVDNIAEVGWWESDLRTLLNARLILKQGGTDQAVEMLDTHQKILGRVERVRNRIAALVELAVAHEVARNREQASEVLHEAIILALAGEVLRPFFERGKDLMPILQYLTTKKRLRDADVDQLGFVTKIITVWNGIHGKADSHLLTRREREITKLLVGRMSNKLIARNLDISPATVRFHLKKIYEKFGVNDRRLVADLAKEHKLLDQE